MAVVTAAPTLSSNTVKCLITKLSNNSKSLNADGDGAVMGDVGIGVAVGIRERLGL